MKHFISNIGLISLRSALFLAAVEGQAGLVRVTGNIHTSTQPVKYAMVSFIDQSDTTKRFSTFTDTSGNYRLDLTITQIKPRHDIPTAFELEQNYPNPFSSSTNISYKLNRQANTSVRIYNVLGQVVKQIRVGTQAPGIRGIVWDGTDNLGRRVTPGVYFYRVTAGNKSEARKMLLGFGSQNAGPFSLGSSAPGRRKFKELDVSSSQSGMFTVRVGCIGSTLPQILPAEFPAMTISRDTAIDLQVEELHKSAPATAAYWLAAVDSLAATHKKGLRLVAITGQEVNYDGTAGLWKYEYTNPTVSSWPVLTYWFHADSGGVSFDSTSTLQAGIEVMTRTWFNSDSALTIAESHGGSEFRSANPSYTIEASLDEPLVRDPTTYWRVTYRSGDDSSKYLSLSIDANSGKIVFDHPLAPAPNTAAYRLASVDSLAKTYVDGLLLMTVSSNDVKLDGTAEKWTYLYVNPPGIVQDSSMYWFHADSGGVSFDSTSAVRIGAAVIYAVWFNSDSAFSIAEQNGGSQFRNQNPNYTIEASVGGCDCPYIETDWWIIYRSRDDKSKTFTMSIDATTGAVVYKSEL